MAAILSRLPKPLRRLLVPFVAALPIGVIVALLISRGGDQLAAGLGSVLSFLAVPVLATMLWSERTRPWVGPIGCAVFGFALAMSATNAITYWNFIEPQTHEGSNPRYSRATLEMDTIRTLGLPFLSPLLFAMISLAPPLGGSRWRWVACGFAVGWLALAGWMVQGILESYAAAPQGWEVGFGIFFLVLLVVSSAPALYHIGRSFRPPHEVPADATLSPGRANP